MAQILIETHYGGPKIKSVILVGQKSVIYYIQVVVVGILSVVLVESVILVTVILVVISFCQLLIHLNQTYMEFIVHCSEFAL